MMTRTEMKNELNKGSNVFWKNFFYNKFKYFCEEEVYIQQKGWPKYVSERQLTKKMNELFDDYMLYVKHCRKTTGFTYADERIFKDVYEYFDMINRKRKLEKIKTKLKEL